MREAENFEEKMFLTCKIFLKFTISSVLRHFCQYDQKNA